MNEHESRTSKGTIFLVAVNNFTLEVIYDSQLNNRERKVYDHLSKEIEDECEFGGMSYPEDMFISDWRHRCVGEHDDVGDVDDVLRRLAHLGLIILVRTVTNTTVCASV